MEKKVTKIKAKPSARRIATGYDKRNDTWSNIALVRDPMGRENQVAIPFEATEADVFKLLARHGFPRPSKPADRAKVLEDLCQSKNTEIVQVASTPG
jgi:hypothetical protein